MALERSGNAAVTGGFRPVEGGYECAMTHPLDFELLRGLVPTADNNVHLGTPSDMVWCSHCWSAIIGPRRIAEAEGDSHG
jgi:hypothetical protein